MLQPSKHALVKGRETTQDSAGIACSVVNLRRGERRNHDPPGACGRPLSKRRHHARASEWRAQQEVRLTASPMGQKRATSPVSRLFETLQTQARTGAEQNPGARHQRDREGAGPAGRHCPAPVRRLSGPAASAGKTALRDLTRDLMTLRRHHFPGGYEENRPDRG